MRVETQLAVGNGAAKVERVKVAKSNVASEEDGMRTVERYDLIDDVGDGVRIRPTEPLYTRGIGVHRDVLGIVECDDTVDVRVRRAVEGARVDEEW